MPGYSYINEYEVTEIKQTANDFKEYNLEEAKIGSIIKIFNKVEIPLIAKFITDNYYLIKLDYKEINKLGKCYFNYGVLKSSKIDDEQCYLIIKAKEGKQLKLIIEGNDILPYQINLKNIMIINITHLRLTQDDVGYLPFI